MLAKFRFWASFLAVLLLFPFGGGTRAQGSIDRATVTGSGETTPEISTAELRTILREGSAAVLDVRPFREFAMGHIPGASNVAPRPGMSISLYISDVHQVGRIVKERTDAPIVLYGDGPFSDNAKRLGEELLVEGFTNVKRYQLGLSVWRALGGITQMELSGIALVITKDRTAQLVDARDPQDFERKTLPGAINLPLRRVTAERTEERIQGGAVQEIGKDDPVPIEDHSARAIVFGDNSEQAIAAAERLQKEGFTNVSFFAGSFRELAIIAVARNGK